MAAASWTAFASPPQLSSAGSSYSSPAFAYPSGSHSLQFLPLNPLKFKPSRIFSVRFSASAADDSVVTLLDYGAGNVRSLRNAIRFLGCDIKDVQGPEDILNAKRLIFPGVGAFAPAMDVLNKKGLAEALCAYIEQDRPFLGICLGLQLLFKSSEENGPVKGLGLIPGVVGRFDSSNGCRVPHIGWNAIKITKDSKILDDIGNRHVYFVHSYRAIPVIACLDVRANDKGDLVVTKGDQYDVREHTKENEVRNLGKPVDLAGQYYKDGADEVKMGKSSLEQISRVYGNQAVVVSIDPRRVYLKDPTDVEFKSVNGGREGRPIGAYELAKAVEELGAGEILLNCIDCDGQGKGFDIDLIKLISDAVSIPVIASSGAGAAEHFSEVFSKTNASAALAAGIFHRKEVPIQSVKEHLLKEGVEVRI
ncbi:hypothetical protein DH2020_041685 [Rehmannia glutinosa]|uniref:Glutamine amidotransferase domain-containing protein n=1 Tax=Rehmannia glutinosa TaxID=99300 RepID=A0ABR0UQ61_REHGL